MKTEQKDVFPRADKSAFEFEESIELGSFCENYLNIKASIEALNDKNRKGRHQNELRKYEIQ